MKKAFKTALLISSISIAVFGAALAGHFIYNKEIFEGEKTHEMYHYALNVTKMNGVDSHEMPLTASDRLEIEFRVLEGSFRLTIKDPDRAICYEGNGKETSSFVLMIAKTGTYAITVKAHYAKGNIQILKRIPPTSD